jgi:hypothetical protein
MSLVKNKARVSSLSSSFYILSLLCADVSQTCCEYRQRNAAITLFFSLLLPSVVFFTSTRYGAFPSFVNFSHFISFVLSRASLLFLTPVFQSHRWSTGSLAFHLRSSVMRCVDAEGKPRRGDFHVCRSPTCE